MAYTFDLEAAVNKIAELEQAIASPKSGVVTAYGFEANPSKIEGDGILPATVHVFLGPSQVTDFNQRAFRLVFEVISKLLIVEARREDYPDDDAVSMGFWQPVLETFASHAARVALTAVSGASVYELSMERPSYGVRPWPPIEGGTMYWSYQYIHRFWYEGG